MLTEENGLIGIDLDHCRDPDTGVIQPWALTIVKDLNTYAEVSPSGEGLRLWARGHLPPGRRKKDDVEMYSGGRYLTVTGCRLQHTPYTIEPRQAAIDALHVQVFAKSPAPSATSVGTSSPNGPGLTLEDDTLLQKALGAKNGGKFAALWAGHAGDYPSQSEADLALCRLLAFWTTDRGQIDRLFRRSGLSRGKWDERHGVQTYGERTVALALSRPETWDRPTREAPGPNDHDGGVIPPTLVSANGAAVGQEADDAHLTDRGNAIRLVHACGADMRYSYAWRKWLAWTGTRWVIDGMGTVEACAKGVIAELYGRAERLIRQLREESAAAGATRPPDLDPLTRKTEVAKAQTVLAWVLKSEDARRIHAMLDLARSEPGIPLNCDNLDCDPWLLNVSNGTLNLRTGTLQPHRRDDLLTKITLIRYDPHATCPRWCQFLHEIMGKSQDLINYLQRAVGYSLTGSVQEQVLFFLYGLGANGKSTFLSTILALLGEYAMQAMPELLLVRTGEHHPTERADLFGKRLVATVEVEAGKQLAEALTKLLTGGERIRARRMREDAWEFDPSHKLWLAANHKPLIKGTDHAMWRRIKLIPFTTTIADDRKDPKLLEKLIAELPGILRWAIEGCLAWQQGGLQEPKEVTDAVHAYQLEMDIVGQFLDDCCWLKPDRPEVRTQSSILYQAFCRYAGDIMTQTAFSERLTARGYTKRKTDGRYRWIGIGLNAPEDTQLITDGSF